MTAPVLERTSHWATLVFVPGWWTRQRGADAWLDDYNDIASEPLVGGEEFELIELLPSHAYDVACNPVFAVVGTRDRKFQLVLIHVHDYGNDPRLICRDPLPGELERLLAA